MTFHDFATKEHVLRMSSLPSLLQCPARHMLAHMLNPDRTSGVAADTGTATHVAIEAWHDRVGKEKSLAIMREKFPTYQKADLHQAERYFDAYIRDPRNTPEEVQEKELEVTLTLPPHELDPTGQEVHLVGHLDQIRRDGRVWDIKTGEPQGWEMLHHHATQLAAYRLGAEVLRPDVSMGGIIRVRSYYKRVKAGETAVRPEDSPRDVFLRSTLTKEDCMILMDHVRLKVALIRRGRLMFTPGEHCRFCFLESLADCMSEARRIKLL